MLLRMKKGKRSRKRKSVRLEGWLVRDAERRKNL